MPVNGKLWKRCQSCSAGPAVPVLFSSQTLYRSLIRDTESTLKLYAIKMCLKNTRKRLPKILSFKTLFV